VGVLVIGTAFPHLLKSVTGSFPWHTVVYATSALSVFGGMMMMQWIPNGPFRKQGQQLNFNSFLAGFCFKNFTSVPIGYFGHM